jgi:hypothetical protein
MIRQNTFISIFAGLSLLLLPIYPNSSTIDFGGHIDVSLVYIFILLITGISKTKVLIGLISLFFYQSLSDSYSYIELAVKILTSYIFIIYIQKFFWENLRNDSIMLLIFLSLFYFVSFILYNLLFNVKLYEYLSFIGMPIIYNFFISMILLIIIKYTSWPKAKDQTYQF